ncbi:MAG: DUF2190 family protein [Actinobacteria bacterium]|nr:DUF2190 family protein [Actinomycetota bacterium]MCA1807294.1 DUF2190 family protein [Actinomycetota bacterium]
MGPNELLDKGYVATAATPLFTIVKQTGVESAELNTTAGGDWLGVAQEEPNADDVAVGRVFRVRLLGISRVVAAGAITARDKVTSDVNGEAVAATAGDHVVGIALTESTAAGDWINVLLTPGVVTESA